MSDTTDTGDSYTTESSVSYIVGITLAGLILLITLSYASYKCNRNRSSSSPPENADNHQLMSFSRGVDEDVLVTFPVFVYSEDTIPKKGDTNGSGCSICLADYKPADVVRLLPGCSHFFHRHCIDTWLQVHPSCPVCRNSPLAVKLSVQQIELTDS